MDGLAGTICEFAERLELEDALFVGSILDGNLLAEASGWLPFAKGLMIIGTFLPSKPVDLLSIAYPNPVLSLLRKSELTDEEIDTSSSALVKSGTVPPSFLAEDIRRSDTRLRAVLGEAIAQGGHKDEVAIVASLKIPLAVVIGAEDQLARESYLRCLRMPSLWRGDLQIIPKAGHLPHWEQPAKFNEILDDFISEVSVVDWPHSPFSLWNPALMIYFA